MNIYISSEILAKTSINDPFCFWVSGYSILFQLVWNYPCVFFLSEN